MDVFIEAHQRLMPAPGKIKAVLQELLEQVCRTPTCRQVAVQPQPKSHRKPNAPPTMFHCAGTTHQDFDFANAFMLWPTAFFQAPPVIALAPCDKL